VTERVAGTTLKAVPATPSPAAALRVAAAEATRPRPGHGKRFTLVEAGDAGLVLTALGFLATATAIMLWRRRAR
jgi:hypothetical protein